MFMGMHLTEYRTCVLFAV